MVSRRLLALIVFALAGCAASSSDQRARRYGSQTLDVPEGALRVTERSELATPRHAFYYLTRPGLAPLTVVIPRRGEPFDQRTADAFTRVVRAEDAVNRVAELGAERIALWFAALGQSACGMPDLDEPHFARAERTGDTLRVTYAFAGAGGARRCVLELADDGSLRGARAEAPVTHAASAQTRRWASDRAL